MDIFEPNDSLATAVAIGDGTYDVAGTGIDWYRIDTLSGNMSFTMTPTDGVNLNMELRDLAGVALRANFSPGAETINFIAPVDGAYYLKIYRAQYPDAPPDGLALNYSLSVDLPVATVRGPDDPGETFATATPITSGDHNVVGTGVDWFRVDVTQGQSHFKMTPTGDLTQNLNLILYDAAGNAIRANPAPGAETIDYFVSIPGTYYLKVINAAYPTGTPNGVSMTYDLAISLPEPLLPSDTPYEPNNDLASAVPLGEGHYNITGLETDWYKIDTLSGMMTFTMTPADSFNLNLELRDAAGHVVFANFGSGAETINYLAPIDGAYYLKVYRAEYPGAVPTGLMLNYALDITLPVAVVRGPDDPGETMATATPITAGDHSVIGTGVDWFRIDARPGQANFTMTPTGGLTQNLNMVLYDATGTAIRSGITTSGSENFAFYIPAEGTYYLNIVNATYPAGTPNGVSMTYDLNLDLPDKSFSVTLPFGPVRGASIAVFDIDNDGRDEIFVGTSKALDAEGNEILPAGLIVLEDDGTVKWTATFPAMTVADPKTGKLYNSTSVTTAPVFSDVNGDGKIDIVVGVGGDSHSVFDSVGQPGDKGGVYALNADGSLIWFFQTKDSFGDDGRPDGVYGAPIVFDIDGDGVREVIFAAWDHYLRILDGRTGLLEKQVNLHDTAGASPTLVDLNNDGLFEIIMPADITANQSAGLPQTGGILHLFNNQLTQTVPGWKAQIASSTTADYRGRYEEQSMWSTAQVADLDRDGRPEIIVGTGNFFQDARGSYIKVWNSDGTLRMTLPTEGRTLAAPLVTDLDGDGKLEIVAGTISGQLHAWSSTGVPLFSTALKPFGLPEGGTAAVVSTPIAVDMNGDGKMEILVTVGSQMVVLNATGQVLSSTTQPELVHYGYEGSPVARDIDHDGKLDLISGGRDVTTNQAVIFRFENLFDATSDHFRTGKYQSSQSLNNIQDFVGRFYESILGRQADPAGGNSWVDLLYSGIRSGADVARGFVLSTEYTKLGTSDLDFVNTLYTAFFGRAADPGGRANWLAQLADGASRSAVLDGFIGSQEFAKLAASFGIRAQNLTAPTSNADVITGTTDSDFIRGGTGDNVIHDEGSAVTDVKPNGIIISGQVYRLYLATLGREPDPGGFMGWLNGLADGRLQLEQTAAAFVGSKEFQNVYGSLTNSQFVELLYHNVLGRAADAGGLASWTARLDGGASRAAVVLGFSESLEFQRNSTPGLDGFMRAGNLSWNDAIEGGAGNDSMNGGIGSDTFIFRRGAGGADVIYGFEPWDNLQLSGFGYTTGADARARMTQVGADVLFAGPGQTITFVNTKLADMARVNFNVS